MLSGFPRISDTLPSGFRLPSVNDVNSTDTASPSFAPEDCFGLTITLNVTRGSSGITYDDFHKPGLSAIGFQDLVIDQILWQDTDCASNNGNITTNSAGKQPAWINYMTAVDRVYGNFADINKDMFMVLNRRYEADSLTGAIQDMSTYIDPAKFNFIFATTELDSQNFWVQINKQIECRRKMSAKVMPNL